MFINSWEFRVFMICNHQVASSKPAAGTRHQQQVRSKKQKAQPHGWAFCFLGAFVRAILCELWVFLNRYTRSDFTSTIAP